MTYDSTSQLTPLIGIIQASYSKLGITSTSSSSSIVAFTPFGVAME